MPEKLERCVKAVMAKGHDESSAYAICNAAIAESAKPDLASDELWQLALESLKDTGDAEERSAGTSESDTAGNASVPGSESRYTEFQPAPGWQPVGSGMEWEVTIIGLRVPTDLVSAGGRNYIPSKNGRLYAEDALRLSAPMWEGVKVYDNHLTDAEFMARQGMRSVASEWLGTIINPRYDEYEHKLVGTLKVVDQVLAGKLLIAHQQGVLSSVGLSIDTAPIEKPINLNGQQVSTVEGFRKIYSVDLVAEPAAGGGFNRLIAAVKIIPEEVNMPENEKQDAVVQDAPAVKDVGNPAPKDTTMSDQVRRLECKLILNEQLAKAKLPEALANTVREAFEGRIFETVDLEKVIARAKEAQSATDPSGQPKPVGNNVHVTHDEHDKYEVEFLRMVAGNTL